MQNTARSVETFDTVLTYGEILEKKDESWSIETSYGTIEAIKAIGCLLEPEVGDRVLLSENPTDRAYILSILERAQGVCNNMAFNGDVNLKVNGGGFKLLGDKVSLGSATEISMTSPMLRINARKGISNILEFAFLGNLFKGNVSSARLNIGTLDSRVERLSQKIKRSYRWVEELDQNTVGRLRYIIKDSMIMKAKRSFLLAREKVKINGKRINLG